MFRNLNRSLPNIGAVSRAAALLVLLAGSLFAQRNDPVILIPGLSGSELRNKVTGEKIWFKTLKPRSEDIRLPLSLDIAKIGDNVEPGEIIRSIKIGPIPLTDIYGGFVKALEVRGGYREEKWDAPSEDGDHDSLYLYSYDWRLDNVENARRLVRKVEALKKKLGKPELKFDVVGHSMGGIIARYAAMYGDADLPAGNAAPRPTWAGGKHFDQVILMGTPSEGSTLSLSAFVDGFTLSGMRIDLPFIQDTSRFTAFTIPVTYQLLPAPGTLRVYDERLEPVAIDLYDPATWTKYGWNPIDDRDFADEFTVSERKIAPSYFAAALARAKRLYQALSSGAPVRGISLHLVGSDCKTALDAVVIYRDEKNKRWKTLFRPKGFTRGDGIKISESDTKQLMVAPGDEVVTRRSLEGANGASSTKFICGEHSKLASNTMVQDYVIGLLTGRIVPSKPEIVGAIGTKGELR
jgi:pimeloyl-ACP methyl ester carboxylesterase